MRRKVGITAIAHAVGIAGLIGMSLSVGACALDDAELEFDSDAQETDALRADASVHDAGIPRDAGSISDGAVLDAIETDAAVLMSFNAVHAIFAAKCGPCHTTSGSGGHDIGAASIAQAYADSQLSAYSTSGTKGAAARVRILSGTMPGAGCSGDPATDSGNASCLTQAEHDVLESWLADGQGAPQ